MPAPITPARGAELPQAKLDRRKVENIRVRAAMGVSQRLMAEQYGVHYNCIWMAVNHGTWWHIE